jgi:8-oxo-dGTP pyrophosphatase MutT (NUDIX family)
MAWPARFEPILTPLMQAWFSLTRPMTLGVRVLVTNAAGEVLLVRHTYRKGWELPGGGVERGERAGETVARELLEEAGVRALEPARLISIHSQEASFKGDHVLFYRVYHWDVAPTRNLMEIEAVDWFGLQLLPVDLSAGSRRRIGEALLGREFDPDW